MARSGAKTGRCATCARRAPLDAGGRCDRCWQAAVGSDRESDRTAAARRTDLPTWALATLAADRSPLVRAEIAERDDLPDRIIATLADPATQPHRAVLRRIARHPRLRAHARALIHTDDVFTLRHVAQNPTCPPDALALLARHPDRSVHERARARVVAAALDDEQRRRLPLGLRHLLG
ncbi:MAG TPA: hypothetical protein VF015_07200 [Acidimicrobiales bacterium]